MHDDYRRRIRLYGWAENLSRPDHLTVDVAEVDLLDSQRFVSGTEQRNLQVLLSKTDISPEAG